MTIKTLAAVAAVGCAFALNADVTSANIVGYNSADKADLQYVSVGVGFANVGDEGVFTLGQIVPKDGCWDSGSDILQVLNNTAAKTVATYVYYGAWEGAEEDEIGWWDSDFNDMYNDLEFPVGAAFLGNFGTKAVEFQQSGSVLTGGTTLDFITKQYVMLGNILPKSIKFGDIKPFEGCWDSGSDILQVLNDTAAKTIATYVYYGAWEGAEEDEIGWWDSDFNDMYNDLDVNPGDAWLGNFGAKDVKLAFPGALD